MKEQVQQEERAQLAIEAPPNANPMQQVFDNPVIPIQLSVPNPNVEAAIVPFEPNWDDDTDFDLMKIVSNLEDGKLTQLQVPNTSTISQNLM